MRTERIRYVSKNDGLRMNGSLFYKNVEEAKYLVVIFHGMEEHRFRYDYFASKLVEAGHVVLSLDHRGHGETEEVLGFFASKEGWKLNLDDLNETITQIQNRFSNLKLVLFGHSMGSLFALSYLKRYERKLDCLILSGIPAPNKLAQAGITVASILEVFYGEKAKSKFLYNLAIKPFNKKIKNPKTQCDWISYNEDNVANYLEDERCGFGFTISGYKDLFSLIKDAYSFWETKNPMLPIGIFVGEDDPCNMDKLDGVMTHFKNNGYRNVQLTQYPQMRHEILNELEKDKVINDILDFIKKSE